jgi:predicted phage terminase large subunit-like protein
VAELAEALHLASPAACAEHLSAGKWVRAPHLTLLSAAVVDLVFDRMAGRPGPTGLIVCMPPRNGKSTTTTLWTPTWFLGLMPERMVGLGCYGDAFARQWGRKVRNNLGSLFPELQVSVAEDSRAADEWHTAEGGGMVSSGIGGEFTGRGFHLLVVDDPVKNAEDAQSPTIQQKHWDWWLSTARTRLEPGGVWIMVLTRWDENDLAGRIMKAHELGPGAEGYDDIRVLSLPAIAEEGDELGREVGEALWPERFDEQAYESLKSAVGPYWWAALYQQHPTPKGGDLIKEAWWNYWVPRGKAADFAPIIVDGRECRIVELPELDGIFQSWDMNFRDSVRAIEKGREPDAVSGQVVGRHGADMYWLDRFAGRVGLNETIHAVRELSAAWPEAHTKLVEDTANGPAIMSRLRHEIGGFVPVTPHGSKTVRVLGAGRTDADKGARAISFSASVAGGNCYLPHPSLRPWALEFRSNLGKFPKGGKDDTDAASQAWSHAQGPAWKEVEAAHREALKDGPPATTTDELLRRRIAAATQRQLGVDDDGKPKRSAAKAFRPPWGR